MRARLTQVVSNAFDRNHLQDLLEEKALAHDEMGVSIVYRIREKWRELRPEGYSRITLNRFSLKRSSAWEVM